MKHDVVKSLFASLALLALPLSAPAAGNRVASKRPTDYVNPLLGTATLWTKEDLGYTPTHRAWGAEVFPGASLPNAMVQLTPVTRFHSGSGYQYEDPTIQGFAHTSKGHWNLCNVPLLPADGSFDADDFASPYSHARETAHPGYYGVYLERYGVDAQLTSTLRCAYHKYRFDRPGDEKLIVDLPESNERVRGYELHLEGDHGFSGNQKTGDTIYFYAVTNHAIRSMETRKKGERGISVLDFAPAKGDLELKIGFSFVSVANAKENLRREMLGKSFGQVRKEATATWETLLSKIKVDGGTERQRGLFYSTLYRSFLWPALRSDANGDFTDVSGKVVNKGFDYYTEPSLWDDYRNKLVLLGMLSPKVSANVIQSLIDKGEKKGFMPTFFHGDHAAAYVAGAYARGLRGYDVASAYNLLLRNATIEGGTRPHIAEYMAKGYVPEQDLAHPVLETVANAGVTKTLEYAYDDYAVAQLAKALGHADDYTMLMARTGDYKNVFDPSTEFMRGRLADGRWIEKFDPKTPYYEYMYREANAWQSTFFAPHDVPGLIGLFKSPRDFENKLDEMFTTPWDGTEAYNLTGFIGQYCQGNQPDHSVPFLYTFVGKPEKSQAILDRIMDRFYGMGKEGLAYAGMDDAGEMSSWYVFSAMGLYPFSPASEDHLVSVPIFDRIRIRLGDETCTIVKPNPGRTLTEIRYEGRKIDGPFIPYHELARGKTLEVITR